MVASDKPVNGVERRGMEVAFSTLFAHLGIDVLDYVELALMPMLFPDLSRACLRIAEFARHGYRLFS